jgi:hypothetical protein
MPSRAPNPQRRALELLAASRDGCTEAIMLAHGFTVEEMVRGMAGACIQAAAKESAEIMPSRAPNPQRRALELLAASRDGCTEAIMLAHGFTVEEMVDLCVAGLVTATPERIVAGGRTVEVATCGSPRRGGGRSTQCQRVGARWIRTT